MHIPPGGGQATGISLPRDTWIPPAATNLVQGPYEDGTRGTYKPNKINSFYGTAKFYTQQYGLKKGGMTAAQREVDSDNAGRTELQAIIQAFTGLRIDHYAEINLIGFYTPVQRHRRRTGLPQRAGQRSLLRSPLQRRPPTDLRQRRDVLRPATPRTAPR